MLGKVTIEAHPLTLLLFGLAGVLLILRRAAIARAAAASMTPRGDPPDWLVKAAGLGPALFGAIFIIVGFGGAVYSFFD